MSTQEGCRLIYWSGDQPKCDLPGFNGEPCIQPDGSLSCPRLKNVTPEARQAIEAGVFAITANSRFGVARSILGLLQIIDRNAKKINGG